MRYLLLHFHVKNGDFQSSISKKIATAMNVRDDFYIASRADAEKQAKVAEEVVKDVEAFIEKK